MSGGSLDRVYSHNGVKQMVSCALLASGGLKEKLQDGFHAAVCAKNYEAADLIVSEAEETIKEIKDFVKNAEMALASHNWERSK